MTANERRINNYIFQIRNSFSLQQVTDHTGVPKTSCHRIIKRWEQEGKIRRVSVSAHPVLFRFNYQKSTQSVVVGGRREFEVQEKALNLGVSSRTVYRIEKRVACGIADDPFAEKERAFPYSYMESVFAEAEKSGKISINKTAEIVGCDEFQAQGILQHMEHLEWIQQEDKDYVPIRRIS